VKVSVVPAVRVSVVIVSFNRGEQLRQSLAALGPDHQVLVVDNGSRDSTPTLDTEFPNVRFIPLPRNFGLTRALNIGIRAADGEYVLLLHDDVRIGGPEVTALAEFLENRADAAAVCPLLNGPQVRPLPTPANPDPPLQPAPSGEEITAECVSGAAIMVRTTFLRNMGHIDERYGNYGSGIEICARIRSSNRKIVILSRISAIHDATPSPVRKSTLEGDRASGTAAFLGKHYGFGASLLYRLKTGFAALFTLRFSVLGGTKIDGSG
jgi:N-acetylglucosaminyl-diphospho-decaprenol L-rhamnosyltransferase